MMEEFNFDLVVTSVCCQGGEKADREGCRAEALHLSQFSSAKLTHFICSLPSERRLNSGYLLSLCGLKSDLRIRFKKVVVGL